MSYRYLIAYSKTQQVVQVFPESGAPGSNFQLIGDFSIEDANADFESYQDDLSDAIEEALAYVGQTHPESWLIKIETYKDGEEIPDREPTSNHGVDVPRAMEHTGEDVPVADVAARHKGDMVEAHPIDREVEVELKKAKKRVRKAKKATDTE